MGWTNPASWYRISSIKSSSARLSVLVGRREEHKDKWCWRTEDGETHETWPPEKAGSRALQVLKTDGQVGLPVDDSPEEGVTNWESEKSLEGKKWLTLWGCTTRFAAPWKTWPWTRTGFISGKPSCLEKEQFSDPKVCYVKCVFWMKGSIPARKLVIAMSRADLIQLIHRLMEAQSTTEATIFL